MTSTANPVSITKNYIIRNAVFLGLVVLVLGGMAVMRLTKAPDTAALAAATADAAQQGAQRGAQQTPVTEPAPPATVPAYDYLECSSVQSGDPTPCVPVLVWPLTDGAKQMIGRQKGASYALNTANTRIIYDQIRNKMAGVDACSMWLSIAYDAAANPLLTVWPSQAKAPQGAAKLVDCSPRAGSTAGTIPTAGLS